MTCFPLSNKNKIFENVNPIPIKKIYFKWKANHIYYLSGIVIPVHLRFFRVYCQNQVAFLKAAVSVVTHFECINHMIRCLSDAWITDPSWMEESMLWYLTSLLCMGMNGADVQSQQLPNGFPIEKILHPYNAHMLSTSPLTVIDYHVWPFHSFP